MPSQNLYSKHITLTIDPDLLEQVDDLAKRDYTTRSDVIRVALLEYLRKPMNAGKLVAEPGRDVALEQVIREFNEQELTEE